MVAGAGFEPATFAMRSLTGSAEVISIAAGSGRAESDGSGDPESPAMLLKNEAHVRNSEVLLFRVVQEGRAEIPLRLDAHTAAVHRRPSLSARSRPRNTLQPSDGGLANVSKRIGLSFQATLAFRGSPHPRRPRE